MFGKAKKESLSEVASITMGQSPDSSTYNSHGDGIPFCQGKAEFGEKYVKPTIYCSSPNKIAQPGDILMSVRAPVGCVNITQERCCIGRGLSAICAKPELIQQTFLFYALCSIESEIAALGTGSTFKAINKDQLLTVAIPVPAPGLQSIFSDFVEQVDKSKFALTQALADLDKTIKGILNQALEA